jgi:hypothetical protein
LPGLLAISSCNITDDPGYCCYNARLEYRYHRNGATGENEIGYYIRSLREYIFDGDDILAKVSDYSLPHGVSEFFTEQTLRPGRYSVITLGNKGENELVGLHGLAAGAEVGVTTREELMLTLSNPQIATGDEPYAVDAPQVQGRSDRLYYGYRSFSVSEFGVSRTAVDMTHAHCILNITARWMDRSGHPRPGEQYTFMLRQAPSKYRFLPEFLVTGGWDPGEFDPEGEVFPARDRRNINYIPQVIREDRVCHTVPGSVNRKDLYGQTVTFRYRSDSHVLLSIWAQAGRVMKEIDLYRFFREYGISLDYSLCQEYSLIVEIDGDNVRLSLVTVDDWEDGGEL